MRASVVNLNRSRLMGLCVGLALVVRPPSLSAQSLTSGSLRGAVETADGEPVSGASVTLERGAGGAIRSLSTDHGGGFTVQLLTPGEYRVLVEQIGFQPVRVSGIVIAPGTSTSIVITLQRRPPPITSVTEQANAGVRGGGAPGLLLTGGALTTFDRPLDLTAAARLAPLLVGAEDGRSGLGLGGSGLDISQTRLFVDGIRESLLRHPGFRSEPPTTPVFSRQALNQIQFLGPAADLEWRGGPGSLVAAQTRTGGGRVSLAPWATFSSASLAKNASDNPGDSTGTSFQVGATLSASIVPDTAHLFLEGAYQSLQQPSAYPWALDSARFGGTAGSLRDLIPTIGNDSFQVDLGRFAAPTVRTWKGGHGQARLDWQLGATNRLQARLGFAGWKETNPLLGAELYAGTGTTLNARDLSGAISVTSTGSLLANELRAGFSMARREWKTDAVPGTLLAGDGIGFGASPGLPATFDTKRLDLSDAMQYALGEQHRLKFGASLSLLNYQQDYRFGSGGEFRFGDVDGFARGTGTFFRISGPAETAKFSLATPGVFLQDTWTASPEIQLQLGLRYDAQVFPKHRIAADTAWFNATGISNDTLPKGKGGIAPRASFLWNVQNRGEWIVRGDGGLYYGEIDPSLFAEASLFDGAALAERAQGSFTAWPAAPAGTTSGKRLTMFSPSVRLPRTSKFEVGIARGLRGGTTLSVSGSYGHTDFLLRREDLNRADAGSRTTQDGRPLYGSLVQQGGLVSAAPGSNRKFAKFDLVSGLAPTGFVDHYEVTAELEHQATRGLSFTAAYTFGKTTDNLVGLLQADPADQLDPFAGSSGADWSDGRSDLDVPHRVAASAQYKSTGKTPVTLGARWRWRSGLPFTPGFRPGVDLNGDGGGNNDPVFIDSGMEGALSAGHCSVLASAFAERNSCRAPSVQALDLRVSVGLPVRIGGGGTLALTVDAFNVVGSTTGLVDRAALLVDPAQSLSTGPTGKVTVPLLLNPNFGELLSRRVEPRLIRFGVRMDY